MYAFIAVILERFQRAFGTPEFSCVIGAHSNGLCPPNASRAGTQAGSPADRL